MGLILRWVFIGVWMNLLGVGLSSSFALDLKTNPAFRKVFIVVLENEGAEESLQQPFLAELAKKGAYLSDFHAVTHPSQPNYIAMVAGDTYSVHGDGAVNLDARSIADLLEERGKTWRTYAEGYPGGCFLGEKRGKYVRKHVPFLSFKNIQNHPERCARIVNANQLKQDIDNQDLADFSFYVPDLDNDGHDTGVGYADRWLKKTFGPLLNHSRFMNDMLFVVTFDEAGWLSDNQIYTVLYGDSVIAGQSSDSRYDFYSLLRTIENVFGLGHLGRQDATAQEISGIWR